MKNTIYQKTSYQYLLMLLFLLIGCGPQLINEKQPSIKNGGRAVSVAVKTHDDKIMVVASESGGLFRTTDSGGTWNQVSGSLTFWFKQVLALKSHPNIFLAVADQDTKKISGGGVYRSEDSGLTWTKGNFTSTINPKIGGNGITYDNISEVLWLATNFGLYTSNDLGKNWNKNLPVSGLNSNDNCQAILSLGNNKLMVIKWSISKECKGINISSPVILISIDGGKNWQQKMNGLPCYINNRIAHNQIAVSKINPNNIYYAFSYLEDWMQKGALYYSTNLGENWTLLKEENSPSRPPFVKLSDRSLDGNLGIDVYFGDGKRMHRAKVDGGSNVNNWTTLTFDHVDPSDIAISKDGKKPILLLSDAGLHSTNDDGKNWTLTGSGKAGYNALQISEIVGQIGNQSDSTNLIFSTQDNYIWTSIDAGKTWPKHVCCEGNYIQTPRYPPSNERNFFTVLTCAPCAANKFLYFNSPPSYFLGSKTMTEPNGYKLINAPTLIGNSLFAQNLIDPATENYYVGIGEIPNVFPIDVPYQWNKVVALDYELRDIPQGSSRKGDDYVFVAVREPGIINNAPKIGIRKISKFDFGLPIVTKIDGYGNIGTHAAAFANYVIYGVMPSFPQYILLADIENEQIKKSSDGGVTWIVDTILTNLVTSNGTFKLTLPNGSSQVSAFGFDPVCDSHILVGTKQNGIFETFDFGITWNKIEYSELIPNVGSFFFVSEDKEEGEVLVSSYGRGLWSYIYDKKACDEVKTLRDQLIPPYWQDGPNLWAGTLLVRISKLISGLNSTYYLIAGEGEISELSMNAETNHVVNIELSSGAELKAYNFMGEEMDNKIAISESDRKSLLLSKENSYAQDLYAQGIRVKGVHIKDGQFNGYILHNTSIYIEQLPLFEKPKPQIFLSPRSTVLTYEQVNSTYIKGKWFQKNTPLEIFVNNRQIEIDSSAHLFDSEGVFQIELGKLMISEGTNSIVIRQSSEEFINEDIVILTVKREEEF